MASIHEEFSGQLAQWEKLGRGWKIWPVPVFPEPPFRPFLGYTLPTTPVIDDGRKPTVLSSFIHKLAGMLSTEPPVVPTEPEAEEEAEANILERDSLVELQVSLPAKYSGKPQDFAQVLSQLSFCKEPVSFEILGTAERIITQLAVHPYDSPTLRRQLKAHFSEAVVIESEGLLQNAWASREGCEVAVVEFGLREESFVPLASVGHDPFIGIIGSMADLAEEELALFQVIFQPISNKWAESIERLVIDEVGKPVFVNAPELAEQAQEKISSPLFAAVLRVATRANDFNRAWMIARDLATTFRVFARIDGNELIPLKNDDYPVEEHHKDVPLRQCRRSGMILNTEELLGFVHLPSASVHVAKLVREITRTKPVPKVFASCCDGLHIGTNLHAGQTVEVRLTEEQRSQHIHLMGVSGSGKSTLLLKMIRQDIENGEGVAVLDPHGDLIDRILETIPPQRIQDVVLIDPADEEYSVGFNILSAHSDLEKTLLASDLVSVFQRLSTSWGDQLGSVFQNAIMAFLESSEGGTLSDLRRFLIEPSYRNQFLATVRDPDILYYWKKGFALLSGNKSVGSVLTRLETFLSPKPIRYMVSQRRNHLDFAKIMNTGKIFLAKLSQGQIGKENAFLLGSLFVAKFQETAMSRQSQESVSRRPFWLYIDEFHNFITPSMAEILTGARKYRLGLILAHQELRQLQRDSEVASAVLANPYTRICFRLGDEDARKMTDGFSLFEAQDLQNLDRGHAICRLERKDCDFNLIVPPPEKTDPTVAKETKQKVVEASRKSFSTPRAEIEAEIMRSLGLNSDAPSEKTKSHDSVKTEIPEEPETKAEVKAPSPTGKQDVATSVMPAQDSEKPRKVSLGEADEKDQEKASAEPESGDRQHVAIMKQIAGEAESLDYTVRFEEPLLNGKGRPDIVLRRGKQTIACEVTVTTLIGDEVDHILKRLASGFDHVACISTNRKKLVKISELLKGKLPVEQEVKVGFYAPEEFVSKLYELAKGDPEGAAIERGKPKKQKITLGGGLSDAERKQREAEMLAEIAQAMARKPKQ
jgi:hypothetical protein